MIKYKVILNSSTIEFDGEQKASDFASENQVGYEQFEESGGLYDPTTAAMASILKGRQIAEFMLIELNSRAKEYRHATGIAVGSSLIDLNSKLENYLNKGALEPDSINEMQRIIETGQVDNFLDVYASALLQIDDFLGA